ncbi:hypothetical protein [Anaeromyxobacter terrae]|uniref:hypothetical protein n=1 Tax=Anaeromyxobacter terrae TaxID=2925406 RepID=UPI001F589A7A|nr:hypothetical protein [Anaeromyxobacter sp. SG22]
MNVGIALLTLFAAVVMTLSVAVASRRRRRTRALPGGLDLDLASTADLLPAGLKHLGARLNEPLSFGLRIPPPHAATAQKRLGQLIGLR